jgi:hypothetical protein
MTDFDDWCTLGTPVPIGGHQTAVLESCDDAKGSVALAASLPNSYAKSDSLAMVAERFGKEGVAKFLRNKLPTKASARSGDLPLLAGAESVGDPIAVLPVLFHLMWCQELTVDLSVPLHDGSRVRIAGNRR